MPIWVAAIVGGFLEICTSLVGRVLVAMGLGLVTYSGLDAGLEWFRHYLSDSIGSSGAVVAGMMGVLQLDVVFSIFTAAATLKLLIAGASSSTMKRWMVR